MFPTFRIKSNDSRCLRLHSYTFNLRKTQHPHYSCPYPTSTRFRAAFYNLKIFPLERTPICFDSLHWILSRSFWQPLLFALSLVADFLSELKRMVSSKYWIHAFFRRSVPISVWQNDPKSTIFKKIATFKSHLVFISTYMFRIIGYWLRYIKHVTINNWTHTEKSLNTFLIYKEILWGKNISFFFHVITDLNKKNTEVPNIVR